MLVACGETKTAANDDPCAQVSAMMEGRQESPPFKSLTGEQAMMGETPLPDSWESRQSTLGGACRVNAMRGFFGGDTSIYTYSCTMFEAGTTDEEADGKLAEAAYQKAVNQITTCLGDGWTAEIETESSDHPVYHKTTFEPVEPEEQTGDFRAYPLYVEKSFTPFFGRTRGTTPGWKVTVQAQKQVEGTGE
ncbi:hypothetical protein HY3_12175 [Hyphomonas pacifica]|uniref:Uncharacterized protein n=2 Tax=Hyphomonas pacifica TaxID=1280941 RepID=A0A8B2PNV7_9PROT|nr:hypothetical protein HY3_12175 [Hyphomonas pacifica]RAN35576.1 hypothetical protein HY11_13795 [Hyphomonas pacifica]